MVGGSVGTCTGRLATGAGRSAAPSTGSGTRVVVSITING